ncbi:MAG: signal peptidase I [Clostridium sp.]|nr:signal peptidase I [Clostridium sp.]MCM1444298.1 signal peptidase I [Candidatus Amulumruptor caecigallinarius]
MRDLKEIIKDILIYVIIIVIIILVMKYVISFQQVVGPSMEPNYKSGDLLILNKISYRFRDPKRFEVIVLEHEDENYMIKRIIGLPGEKIEYKDEKLYVNGEEIMENFARGETDDYSISELKYEVIPEDYYFVLGDNRGNSKDSRAYGFINKKEIVGKVQFRIWPISR